MTFELDHCFVMVDHDGGVADLLVDMGLEESFSRDHPGQGTSNRRFELSNSMIEFLWVRDANEASNGSGRKLNFVERSQRSDASPFGIILRAKEEAEVSLPYEGWTYQPDYFSPPMAFHVGMNSNKLQEPLSIYASFIKPTEKKSEEGVFKSLSGIRITTTANPLSDVVDSLNSADKLTVVTGDEHLMEITLDDNQQGLSRDFRPDLPIVIHW